jgi:phospholipid/cholesterol/gamma-HCH transport system substrate-binding protein
MRRSASITWDQLKVGLTILVGLGILGAAVYYIGRAANIFADRYSLVAFLPEAPGLREGGSVMIAGQMAGTIEEISFLPVDGDTTRNLEVRMSINEALREQVRGDSKVKVRTLGLLGDKVLDIRPGTPRYAALVANDTVPVEPSLDYDAILAKAAGAVDDVVILARDFRQITAGLVRGEGTVGQLLTNRELYDQFTGTMARTNAVLARVQTSRGTVGRLLDDPQLYNEMVGLVSSMNTLVTQVNTSEGTVGKLLRDTTLYANLVGITQGGDSLMTMLTQGDGLANKLLTDQTLYDQVNKLVTDLSAILADVRENPQPYTRGLVSVCLFGCKK